MGGKLARTHATRVMPRHEVHDPNPNPNPNPNSNPNPSPNVFEGTHLATDGLYMCEGGCVLMVSADESNMEKKIWS